MKIKIFLSLFALTVLMAACQSAQTAVSPQAQTQSAPAIPFSKGPSTFPDDIKGPTAKPGEESVSSPTNSASSSSAVTEKENVRITIPSNSP